MSRTALIDPFYDVEIQGMFMYAWLVLTSIYKNKSAEVMSSFISDAENVSPIIMANEIWYEKVSFGLI